MYLLSMTFLCLLGFSGLAQANSLVFSDRTAFLSASGAADITPTLTTFTGMGASLNIDGLTFSNPFGKTVFAGVWTPLLPGNDIAINDNEDIDVTLPGDVFALGFDIHEPTGSASTFTATLFNGATSVDSFTFDPPDDVAAFVGIWSDQTSIAWRYARPRPLTKTSTLAIFTLGTHRCRRSRSQIAWCCSVSVLLAYLAMASAA